MHQVKNPFTTLYVTERMEDDKFPSLFSPVLVPHIMPLFHAGNVVVNGTQGTGKSMLLALLRTDIRRAFEASRSDPYPVADDNCQFVSASINLATNQALRFANHWKATDSSDALSKLQDGFVDYANTWLLRDLLGSVRDLHIGPSSLWDRCAIGDSGVSLEDAVQCLLKDEVIRPLLSNSRNLSEASDCLTRRLDTYLRFLNGKLSSLPADLTLPQPHPLGHPIAATVHAWRSSGFLRGTTRVIVIIDQFEQLLDFESQLQGRPFGLLRDIIDDAIHLREPTICYRIGTRPYAWRHRKSERLRDYLDLDLDQFLTRKEHSKNALFPAFAEDVFQRRLKLFDYPEPARAEDPLRSAFGRSPSPGARAKLLASQKNWVRLVRIPKTFPTEVQEQLHLLAGHNPLSAKLGVAWYYQQLNERHGSGLRPSVSLSPKELPWEEPTKKWWKKERRRLAILQLAAGFGQRVPMFGKRDVIDLSGSNILVFASICQHIWTCWIRSLDDAPASPDYGFPMDSGVQDEGIRNASREWHKKISEEPWVGDSLAQFIDILGNYLHDALVKDKAMSYPGGNGISISDRDIKAFNIVDKVLLDGADRGYLLQRRHTPKNRSRGPSRKWYLHPVLSPHYEITVTHTKEPRYLRASTIYDWLIKAKAVFPQDARQKRSDEQQQLPGFESEQ